MAKKIENSYIKIKERLLLFALILLGMCLLFNLDVYAANEPELRLIENFTILEADQASGDSGVNIVAFAMKGRIIKVTSSNSNVFAVKKYGNDGLKYKVKKPGTATVKVVVKNGKKTYTKKQKVHVYKYTTPVKVFNIGKTTLAPYFKENEKKTTNKILEKPTKFSGKLNIKEMPGWKLKKVYLRSNSTGKVKNLKNGSKVSFTLGSKKGTYSDLIVEFQNIKKKYISNINITYPDYNLW